MSETVKPVRLQLSRRKGFNLQELSRATNGLEAVKVTRQGPWGNPFKVSRVMVTTGMGPSSREVETWHVEIPGAVMPVSQHWHETRNDAARYACDLYRTWVRDLSNGFDLIRGKNLACACSLKDVCHADVLLELANAKGHACRALGCELYSH